MAKSKWDMVKSKLTLVEAWCRDGLIETDIAAKLGISKATMENYKKDHIDFLNSLKRGKEVVDVEVENSLYKRANGYTYVEVTKELLIARDEEDNPIKDANGAVIKELKVTKEVIKHMAPDTTAQIFWLKNRKRAEWRDKQDLDINATVNKKLEDYLD